MRLNRPVHAWAAIVLLAFLFATPALFAAEPLSQSDREVTATPSPVSWLTEALEVVVGWIWTSPSVCSDPSCTGSGPTSSPDGDSLPEPDNGPGLDPQG